MDIDPPTVAPQFSFLGGNLATTRHQRQQTGVKNIEISQQSENYLQLPPQLRGDSSYCHVQTAIAAMGGSALRH